MIFILLLDFLIELYLANKNKHVHASDINPYAVENTRHNAQIFKAEVKVFQSDIFESIPPLRYNAVYWFIPSHTATKEIPKNAYIEISVRDPDYKIRNNFFSKVGDYLQPNGRVYMGFNLLLGNYQNLIETAEKYNFEHEILSKMDGNNIGTISLIKFSKKVPIQ